MFSSKLLQLFLPQFNSLFTQPKIINHSLPQGAQQVYGTQQPLSSTPPKKVLLQKSESHLRRSSEGVTAPPRRTEVSVQLPRQNAACKTVKVKERQEVEQELRRCQNTKLLCLKIRENYLLLLLLLPPSCSSSASSSYSSGPRGRTRSCEHLLPFSPRRVTISKMHQNVNVMASCTRGFEKERERESERKKVRNKERKKERQSAARCADAARLVRSISIPSTSQTKQEIQQMSLERVC